MAIAFVASVGAPQSGTTITLTRTTSTGNLLVVGIQRPATTVSSVTDTAGNTWKYLYSSTAFTGGNAFNNTDSAIDVWYMPNATSVTSVTVTMSGADSGNAVLIEASGADATAPLTYYGAAGSTSTAASIPGTNVVGNNMTSPANNPGNTVNALSNASTLVVMFAGYTETSGGTPLDTIVGATTQASRSNNGTHTITSQYKALGAGTGWPYNGSGTNFGWTLSTNKTSGGVFLSFRSVSTAAISGSADGGYEDDLGSNGHTDTTTSWVPLTHNQAWAMPSGTTNSAIPDNAVRAVVTPVTGQLWPRGTQGNGKFS